MLKLLVLFFFFTTISGLCPASNNNDTNNNNNNVLCLPGNFLNLSTNGNEIQFVYICINFILFFFSM